MTRNSRQRPRDHVAVNVEVGVPLATESQARAAAKALIPDNVNMPAGLTIGIFPKGRTVFIRVIGKNVISVATVASTLDEILEHISVARKVMMGDD
jgi:hypothetical protein